MTSGFGFVQGRILAFLREPGSPAELTVRALAGELYHAPTDAQVCGVRRAVVTLERRGLVTTAPRPGLWRRRRRVRLVDVEE
jgi:DNA-binding MarR family transcriptional regulator